MGSNMKRSEAVDLMVKSFLEIQKESTYENDRDLMGRVLEKLEDAGMLPPTTELSHLKGLRDNAWDPE